MGKILLSGFKLEEAERIIADNIIRNYKTKFERFGFEELRLDLRQKPHSKHGRNTLYELKGQLEAGKRFSSEASGLNPYLVMVEVLDKLLHEVEHFKNKVFDNHRKSKIRFLRQ